MENEPTLRRYCTYYGWKLDDLWHREDGPAVVFDDGHMEWYLRGELHRTNGPAVIYSDGSQEWWLNGVEYTEHEYNFQVMMRYSHVK